MTLALPRASLFRDTALVGETEPSKRVLCGQCGQRGAVIMIGNEPVCIPCEHQYRQSRWMVFAENAAMLNHAAQELDAVVGFGPPSPTIEIPRAPVPPLYYNNQNVTVSGGTVGAINLGTANDIQVSLEAISQNGDVGVAEQLAAFTNAVLNAEDAEVSARNELLDQISALSQQAVAQPDERKPGMIKAMLSAIQQGTGAITSTAGAWKAVEPLLKNHFGL